MPSSSPVDGDRFGASGWRLGAAASGGVTAAALDEAVHQGRGRRAPASSGPHDALAAAERVVAEAARRARPSSAARLDANDAALHEGLGGAGPRAGASGARPQVELEPLDRRVAELAAHLDAERRPHRRARRCSCPTLEAGEQAEADAAPQRQRAPRRQLDARAARARRRAGATSRSAPPGCASAPQVLERRLDETERRLAADAERPARGRAASRRASSARCGALDRLGRARRRPPARRRRPPRRAASSAAAARASRSAAWPTGSTRCAASGRPPSAASTRPASGPGGPRSTRPRPACAWSRPSRLLRHDLDVEPEAAEARRLPRAARGRLGPGPGARARARAAPARPDQPARPRGVHRAAAAPRLPRGAARGRAHDPPRAQPGDQGRRPGDPVRLRRRLRRRQHELHDAVRRRCSRAAPAGSCSPQPDDLLNTGIEVEAKPSGKNVKKLSLLSGGERSLTALAFLFAVFRSRPSPFYVMDEVEAALDDVNLHRFLGLVAEFRREAQLLIVSHQKRTMEAGDCLLGVTMQPGGSPGDRRARRPSSRSPAPAPSSTDARCSPACARAGVADRRLRRRGRSVVLAARAGSSGRWNRGSTSSSIALVHRRSASAVLVVSRRRAPPARSTAPSRTAGRRRRSTPRRDAAAADRRTAVLEPEVVEPEVVEPEVVAPAVVEPAALRDRMARARVGARRRVHRHPRPRRDHRRDVGRPRGGAAARRRRHRRHRPICSTGCATQVKAKEITEPEQLLDALQAEMTRPPRRRRPRRCTSSPTTTPRRLQPERVAVRRRQRRRQDDDHRQGRPPPASRGRPLRAAGRRRHVPRRRRRAADDVGRAGRRRAGPGQRGRRPERRDLRRRRAGRGPRRSTSCSATPPVGCTPRPT